MKIFISCALFYPSKLGGPANTLFWLAKGLVHSGHKVYVISTHDNIDDKSIPLDTLYNLEGIHVTYCSNRIRLIIKSLALIRHCDKIILSSICYSPEFIISLWARILRKKTFWSPRGELSNSAINGSRKKIFYFKLIKRTIGKHIIFHATSEDEEKCVRTYFGKNAHIINIPNYMILPDCQTRQDTEEPYFLFLGRIAPIKALENLILGASLSKKFKESNYTLKLAGGIEDQFKDYYNKLISLINTLGVSHKVEFIGPVSGTQKYQLYCDAKFLFLVSQSENFGNVVIESLSQGTPVVASLGTPWCELPSKKAGFWVNNSPEIISAIIDNILDMDNNLYNKYRENAIIYAEEFDIYKNVYRWIKALN